MIAHVLRKWSTSVTRWWTTQYIVQYPNVGGRGLPRRFNARLAIKENRIPTGSARSRDRCVVLEYKVGHTKRHLDAYVARSARQFRITKQNKVIVNLDSLCFAWI